MQRPKSEPPYPSHPAGLITSAYSVALKPPDSFLEGVARTGRYTFTAGERTVCVWGGGAFYFSVYPLAWQSCVSGPMTQCPPLPICPTAAIGAVFGIASCVSAQVRQKPDDPLNYFIGGCAGGLTLGARSE